MDEYRSESEIFRLVVLVDKLSKVDIYGKAFVVEMYHELKLGFHFQNNYAVAAGS